MVRELVNVGCQICSYRLFQCITAVFSRQGKRLVLCGHVKSATLLLYQNNSLGLVVLLVLCDFMKYVTLEPERPAHPAFPAFARQMLYSDRQMQPTHQRHFGGYIAQTGAFQGWL